MKSPARISIERDEGNIIKNVRMQNIFLPSEVFSEIQFDRRGGVARRTDYQFGLRTTKEYRGNGTQIMQETDLFGECKLIDTYDPETGEHLGKMIEGENEK